MAPRLWSSSRNSSSMDSTNKRNLSSSSNGRKPESKPHEDMPTTHMKQHAFKKLLGQSVLVLRSAIAQSPMVLPL